MKIYVGVDLQKDFMDQDGLLYVPGAEHIKENISKLTKNAEDKNIITLLTTDEHSENDDEFKFFPRHCIKGSGGQKIIPEAIGNGGFLLMEREYNFFIQDEIVGNKENCKNGFVFTKATYDIFDEDLGNSNFLKTIKELDVDEAVVYGVATNICVIAVVEGLLKSGIKVSLVEDAILGIYVDSNNNSDKAIESMVDSGATLIKTKEVVV